MPLQNRVLPTGEIVAHPSRAALLTGNRGILHDADRRLGRSRWRHPHWISCVLRLPGRPPRVPMSAGSWTELFFLDEAVALAAGHRPCAYCRRADWQAFRRAWQEAGLPGTRAPEVDRSLHAARLDGRRQRRGVARAESLPDGAFVLLGEDTACLVAGDAAHPYAPGGYGPALLRPRGRVEVLTPEPLLAVLRAGYRPLLHPSCGAD